MVTFFTPRKTTLGFLLVVTITVGRPGSWGRANADSIEISTPRVSYYLFEPLILEGVLRSIATDERAQAAGRRRQLWAELRSDQVKVSEGVVGGTVVRATGEDHWTGLVLLGDTGADGRDGVFHLWDQPGHFELVVVDREHELQSNSISIMLEAPRLRDREAASAFQALGTDVWRALYEPNSLESGGVQQFAERFPESTYTKYARASVAFGRAQSSFTIRVTAESKEIQPEIIGVLEHAIESFDAGHPLWNRGQLLLAQAQRASKRDDQGTIASLASGSRDDYYKSIAFARAKQSSRDRLPTDPK